LLAPGGAGAFATDDVLLHGFIATDKRAASMKVVREFLSDDPYGLVLRRDDPAFAALIERTPRASHFTERSRCPPRTMRSERP
jgi:hypothetical protein